MFVLFIHITLVINNVFIATTSTLEIIAIYLSDTSSTQINSFLQIYKFALPHTVQLFKAIGNWEINHQQEIWI